MNDTIDRRRFVIGTTALIGGVLLTNDRASLAEERNLAEKRLILLGINALARAPEMSYFVDGHRGASMISAHMMCVDNKLDDTAAARIVQLFDLNWASSKLCQPFQSHRLRDRLPETVCIVSRAPSSDQTAGRSERQRHRRIRCRRTSCEPKSLQPLGAHR